MLPCSLARKVSSVGSNKVKADGDYSAPVKPTRTKTESISDTTLGSWTTRCGEQSGIDGKMKQNAASNLSCLPALFVSSSKESSAFNKKQTAVPQVKSYITSTVLSNRTIITATKDSPTSTSSMPKSKVRLETDSAPKIQAALSPHKKSRFTWVKCQGTETSQKKTEVHQVLLNPVSASTPSSVVSRQSQASSKRLYRKHSFPSSTPRKSKYSWVSSSCSPTAAAKSALAKLPHKLFTPKAHKVPGKMAKEGPEGKKPTPTTISLKRGKVGGGASTSQANHGSRYRWKAVAATSSAAVRGAAPRSSRKSSVYQWTAQKNDSASRASRVQHSLSSPLSSSGFKLRSRTKIIRRCSSRSGSNTIIFLKSFATSGFTSSKPLSFWLRNQLESQER